ncbi:protein TIME FOR COFFEE-like [Gastrolobium bilobum]|uniref:protein TIME FOR COFFEE-like n=1 Tax=Gastrolobium bilobum TaxID=150636 RepID=UPI002AB1990B|nr:protein TIME FOR COFFEE-like [Gastrolobium bilobum]
MPSTPNASFPRRRHPTISLRGSSQEGQVELQETVRLKAKRDRDSFKRRRACNSHRTENESVGNEQQQHCETASSISDQNHRRISTALRPWNITDEMIGATVPRKARSATVKRAHESWMEEQSFQSAETASPSSSNVSLRKKMKSIEPKTRFLKTTGSSSTQEDIEIEIAELLYGLRTSKNHESSSQKLEASDSHPSTDAEEKKGENYSSSAPAPNNSTAESFRIESEQPAKMEKPSPESPSRSGCQGDNASCHENESKEDIKEENLNSGVGCGDTADGRSELFSVESPSCSKSKLDVDKQDSTSTRVMCAVPGANMQRVDKFEIDLMAPPPMTLSPERDSLSRGEDKMVERLVEKEKTQEEIEEVQIKFDLEKPNKHKDIATNNELEEEDRNKEEQPTTSRNSKVEKTVQSSSMPLSTTVSEQPCSLSLGYLPPLETVVKTEKTTGSSTAPQHVNLVLSQPRPKRCATHHHIARNIFMHQQCTKVNPFLQSAIGYSSVCDTKPKNVIRMNSAESVVVGKQSQKHSPGMNQNAAQEKGWAATGDYNYSLDAIKSSVPTNPVDSTQMKQLVFRQGPHPESSDNLVHGPAFLFPLGQHQASVTTATSQAGGVNCTSSASSSNKSHSSGAGSLGTSSLPAIGAAMSFSYPNLAANDVSYMTVVQNNGYPFPFSTHLGTSAAIKGASPAPATPVLSGPLYSSQMFYPLQHPQQHPHSKALVQPSYPNASTTGVSSSSHKQSQGTQVNGSNILTSTAMPLQQPAKQHTSLSHSHNHETGMAGQNVSSVASGMAYSQKNVFGQNFPIPVQPPNLSFRQSAKSDSVGSNSGNFSDRQQQQEALKGGVERIPSQAFAISFAAFNGTSVPSNLNFSAMTQNPVIFQSLPDIAWQGYQAASTSHTTQPKIYSLTEGKSGGDSSHQDDEKKATSGKPSTSGPTTLVFDNSSKNLNFVSSPMNGSWPSRSITSTATTTSLPLSGNASNSQQSPQLLHLQQQQHGMLQQQSAMATRYKASSTNATAATKILNSFPVFSPNQTQCKSSNQASQSKNSGRTPDSQILNTSIVTSTTPTLKSFSQEQGRVLQGQTQISFGGNYMSSLPPHGQQLLSNNQPFGTTVAGTPPNGGNLNINPQGSKVCSSMNTSQMHQSKNSSAGTGQKSSPVCGRNVPSILSACPSHLPEMKY